MSKRPLDDVTWKSEIINHYPFKSLPSALSSSGASDEASAANKSAITSSTAPTVILGKTPSQKFKTLVITCPGGKIPIRSTASVKGETIKFLMSGSEFQVHPRTVAGFYHLVEGGFVNKNTRGVEWRDVTPVDLDERVAPESAAPTVHTSLPGGPHDNIELTSPKAQTPPGISSVLSPPPPSSDPPALRAPPRADVTQSSNTVGKSLEQSGKTQQTARSERTDDNEDFGYNKSNDNYEGNNDNITIKQNKGKQRTCFSTIFPCLA